MYTPNVVMDALNRRAFNEAEELLNKGEKLPSTIETFTLKQILSQLIQAKYFKFLDYFIQEGIINLDVYEYETFSNTLFEAIVKTQAWDEESVQWLNSLLQRVENINDELQDITLLGYAFENGANPAIIKAFIAAGCDVQYKNNAEENFIIQVADSTQVQVEKTLTYLTLLTEEGLDIDQQNIVGKTALIKAIERNKTAVIDFLLQNGAQANLVDKSGNSAFYYAVVNLLSLDLYNLLATHESPDFEHKNKQGESILLGYLRMMYTDSPSYLALLERLLDDGASLYQTSSHYHQDKSGVDWIAEKSANVLTLILSKGLLDINQQDNEGNTLLHKICAFNINYEKEKAKDLYRKVKLLLDSGADTSLLNDQDKTAADMAADDNLKSKSVELLLSHQL